MLGLELTSSSHTFMRSSTTKSYPKSSHVFFRGARVSSAHRSESTTADRICGATTTSQSDSGWPTEWRYFLNVSTRHMFPSPNASRPNASLCLATELLLRCRNGLPTSDNAYSSAQKRRYGWSYTHTVSGAVLVRSTHCRTSNLRR